MHNQENLNFQNVGIVFKSDTESFLLIGRFENYQKSNSIYNCRMYIDIIVKRDFFLKNQLLLVYYVSMTINHSNL